MKANELMTGDYVRYKRTKEIIWVFEIDSDRNVINNEPDGYNSETNISIDDIEPIPLTPEILVNNGWVRRCMTDPNWMAVYENKSYPDIWEGTDGNLTVTIGLVDVQIHSSHELQHALRLCGLDNMANNFKV